MATQSISIGDDVMAALNFLGKLQDPVVSGEEYFVNSVGNVMKKVLYDADELRFKMAQDIMGGSEDSGKKVSDLRKLLGV